MADLETDVAPRRRGRPKGTGIDDSELLRRITGLMAADDELKPTTAIKQCGVDNPSIVRRLREKLKTTPAQPPTAPAPTRARQQRSKKPTIEHRDSPPVQPSPGPVAPPPTPSKPDAPPPPSPPLDQAARDAQKAREAALLAAYLKALQATAVPAFDDERGTSRPRSHEPQSPPKNVEATQPTPPRPAATPEHPQPRMPPPMNPFAGFQPSPPVGMMFPFFPPFMQPFAPKPPPPNPIVQSQMEALKLSVEVMTAVTKLQMFAYQNTLAATPLGNMLQAQAMMGQMLLASFTGFSGMTKKPDSGK